MDDLSIQRPTPEDRDAVVALLAAQLHEHQTQTDLGRLGRVFDQILADDRYGFMVLAKARGAIVAIAYVSTILSIEHGARIGWLEELYVNPGQRESGIGSALLARAIDTARALGLAALDLEVDIEHRRAESLYQRFGFERLPRSRWVKLGLAGRNVQAR